MPVIGWRRLVVHVRLEVRNITENAGKEPPRGWVKRNKIDLQKYGLPMCVGALWLRILKSNRLL
jgi:hypothetical protein